jgi:hypothetical protein
LVVGLLGSLGGAVGCAPKIGDKCSVSTDCSVQGDRLCDPTQPAGYCTIFNCEPNRCPEEAVCVAFNEPSCSSPALSRRFQRTFCMFVCKSDSDCRSDYRCLDTSSDPARKVIDQNPQSLKICAVPSPSASMSMPDPAVCAGSDASVPRPEAGGEGGGIEAGAEADSQVTDSQETGSEAEGATNPGDADGAPAE